MHANVCRFSNTSLLLFLNLWSSNTCWQTTARSLKFTKHPLSGSVLAFPKTFHFRFSSFMVAVRMAWHLSPRCGFYTLSREIIPLSLTVAFCHNPLPRVDWHQHSSTVILLHDCTQLMHEGLCKKRDFGGSDVSSTKDERLLVLWSLRDGLKGQILIDLWAKGSRK